jgi:hypothetical protein
MHWPPLYAWARLMQFVFEHLADSMLSVQLVLLAHFCGRRRVSGRNSGDPLAQRLL